MLLAQEKHLKHWKLKVTASFQMREQHNTNLYMMTNEQEKDHIEDLVLDGDLKLILWLSLQGSRLALSKG